MPSYDRPCDVYQGFNFRKDRVTTVGFLTSLKVGSLEYGADLTAKDPADPSTDLMCVAVLSNVSWGIGVTDAVYLSGHVSSANRQNTQTLIYTDLSDVLVTFEVTVYEYDPVAKKYFKGFHSESTVMNGLVEKQGEEVALDVATSAASEVESPENYAFFVGVKPQPSAQEFTIQVSDTAKVVKQWGMTVA